MGAYTLLQDLTVSSNSTSVVLNNFGTITKDDFVKVVATFINSTNSTNAIALFGNTATTTTNYHTQQLRANQTSISALRTNTSRYSSIFRTDGNFPNANVSHNIGYLKISENNRLNFFSNSTDSSANIPENIFRYGTSSGATFTSGIDTLTFTGSNTNGIGTGSRIQIYKLDAEKVADITVTSNTTQVDISNLSIDKDSEYLLVSNLVGVATSQNLKLFVNDNTTDTDYYVQFIRADGSTASAGRINNNLTTATGANETSVVYSHIKLSNIGAYTFQSYEIDRVGKTNPRLQNWFLSSTAENITSITKLNIRSSVTSGLGTGSRFILYKLYE